MKSDNNTQQNLPQVSLEKAINAAKYGRKAEALLLLRTVVAQQPVNQPAWLWLSSVTPDQAEAAAALKQARKIDPTHPSLPKAEQWLVHRFSPGKPTKKTTPVDTKPSPAPRPPVPKLPANNTWQLINIAAFGFAIMAVVLGLIVLFFGLVAEINATALVDNYPGVLKAHNSVQAPSVKLNLEAAQLAQEWQKAIEILEPLHQTEPDSLSIEEQLVEAHVQQGLIFRGQGQIENASLNFAQALKLRAGQAVAQQELNLAATYLAGSRYYQAGQWQAAISELEKVWQADDEYPNVKDMLYSAYYNHGLAQQGVGKLPQAKEAFKAAITLRPDLSLPRRKIAEVEFAIAPETPVEIKSISIENRVIVVGIAEQRMEVYDGDALVYEFIISTGEPGRDTAVGDFEILNKIDVAYASTWNLDMPYWMGIYWAGPLQNGIHSLPIVKHTGYKLWDGYLGQRVSYGCVILGDEDAATLYNWTEIGTKVKIVPSLAYWSRDEVSGS